MPPLLIVFALLAVAAPADADGASPAAAGDVSVAQVSGGLTNGSIGQLPEVPVLPGPQVDAQLDIQAAGIGTNVTVDGPAHDEVRAAAPEAGPEVKRPEPSSEAASPPGAAVAVGAGTAVAAALALNRSTLLAALRRLMLLLPVMAGFTRIGDGALLDQPVRRQAMGLVQAQPGTTISAVADAIGVARTTAAYHLRMLERCRLVVSERQGRDRLYWDVQSPQARLRKTTKRLRGTPQRIAALVQARPGLMQKDICERLELQPSVASRHIKRLAGAGLIELEAQGRARRCRPTPLLSQAWTLRSDSLPAARTF